MLDVARWYKPVAWLYTFVDLAAMHRLNIVHLHLTEDQGWRFEVTRYPRLTEVGASGGSRRVGHAHDERGDGTPHGGFYTQAELRRSGRLRGRRGVTIVPEIDLPGHTQAAIAAYPELGNDPSEPAGGVDRVRASAKRVLNVAESTVEFIRNVLDELIDVFPSEYIHLGGDEVPTDGVGRRARPPSARLAELGLAGSADLLGWWIARLADHLKGARPPRGASGTNWSSSAPKGSTMLWRGADRQRVLARAATPATTWWRRRTPTCT